MESALSGIKVVELGIAIQGPAAGMYLAEHGAEVIKIETPVGEENRHHFGYGKALPKAVPAPQFVANNRGKRLMTLDAKGEHGREVMRRLIAQADVFLTNYRENALNRLGLGYEELHRLNPRLIYAIASGFGSRGPVADRAMLDPMAQARGGLASVTGSPDRPPSLAGAALADTTGAAQLIVGILTALVARERLGVGQRVGTSSYGAQLWHQAFELTYTSMTGYVPQSTDGIHPLAPGGSSGLFRTADGAAVAFLDTLSPAVWAEFCEVAGKPELARETRWDSAYKRLAEDVPDELRSQVAEMFASRTAAQWEAFFSDPYLMFQRVFDYADVSERSTGARERVCRRDRAARNGKNPGGRKHDRAQRDSSRSEAPAVRTRQAHRSDPARVRLQPGRGERHSQRDGGSQEPRVPVRRPPVRVRRLALSRSGAWNERARYEGPPATALRQRRLLRLVDRSRHLRDRFPRRGGHGQRPRRPGQADRREPGGGPGGTRRRGHGEAHGQRAAESVGRRTAREAFHSRDHARGRGRHGARPGDGGIRAIALVDLPGPGRPRRRRQHRGPVSAVHRPGLQLVRPTARAGTRTRHARADPLGRRDPRGARPCSSTTLAGAPACCSRPR